MLFGIRLQLNIYISISWRLPTGSTAEISLQGDLNQRDGTNLVTEFVAKIVSEETERSLYALLANWLVKTGIERKAETAGGDKQEQNSTGICKRLECNVKGETQGNEGHN